MRSPTGEDRLEEKIGELLRIRSDEPTVLSALWTLPRDPAEVSHGLGTRLHSLFSDVQAQVARETDDRRRQSLNADIEAARTALFAGARNWVGRSVAVFAARDLDLFLELRFPCALPNRAVLGTRPHVRPLLAARRRCVPYCAAVVDRRRSWLYLCDGASVRQVRRLEDEGRRSPTFAGWHGLEEYKAVRHAGELARHHYRVTVDALTEVFASDGYELLVVGGHEHGIPEFLAALPADLEARLAGTFVVDPHTMTPALVRRRATGVVVDWENERRRRVLDDIVDEADGGRAVTGLRRTLAAASQCAVETLVVDEDTRTPGSLCSSCGTLGLTDGSCTSCGATTLAVPDVLDELVARVNGAGGVVEIAEPAATTCVVPAARLRHDAGHGTELDVLRGGTVDGDVDHAGDTGCAQHLRTVDVRPMEGRK